MKKVQDIIIGGSTIDMSTNALAEATSAGYVSLAAGELAVVDGSSLLAASASSEVIQVAQYGSAELPFILSAPIYVDYVTKITKKGPVAAVKKSQKVTIGAVTAGEYYAILVRERSEEDFDTFNRQRYEIKASAGETVSSLIGRFVDKINADPGAVVTAASADGNTTLELTAKYDKQEFETATTADAAAWAVSTSQALVQPVNTYEEVKALEEYARGYKGHLNRIHLPLAQTYYSEAGATYTTYTVEHKQPKETNEQNLVKGIPIVTTIAIKHSGVDTTPADSEDDAVGDFEAAFITATSLSL